MTDTPRVVLHNDETARLASALRDRFPQVDFRACDSYDALPPLLESFAPDVVYSVRFSVRGTFPRDALLGPSGPRWLANGGVSVGRIKPPFRVLAAGSLA